MHRVAGINDDPYLIDLVQVVGDHDAVAVELFEGVVAVVVGEEVDAAPAEGAQDARPEQGVEVGAGETVRLPALQLEFAPLDHALHDSR